MIKIKNTIALAISVFAISFTTLKPKPFIPPGTAQITESFFADETEISNFAWQEYEFFVKTEYGYLSPEHLAALPDTLVWRQKMTSNEPYVKYYYRHPAYKGYPVVGISYEQAIAFCKWRTERVKEFYYIKNKKELIIEYRLPTKEEWELISSVPPYYLNEAINKKGEVTFNHRWMSDSTWKKYYEKHKSYPDVTAKVYSYEKNLFGLFNLYGNVAEMVSEKGICKGGGWRNLLEECRAGKDIPYTQPTAWLGFRCVCVITK
jgi:formylglycine-generating enzyme required for sulfatase activity